MTSRRLKQLVKGLHGRCELMAKKASGLEYQLGMQMRGKSCREILREIQEEALTVVGMCEHANVLLDEGARICRI